MKSRDILEVWGFGKAQLDKMTPEEIARCAAVLQGIPRKIRPAVQGVIPSIWEDSSLSPANKNTLWQDIVDSWKIRRVINNEQAEVLAKLSYLNG